MKRIFYILLCCDVIQKLQIYILTYSTMKLKKASSVDYVHQFSDLAYMKFKPGKLNLKIQSDQAQQQNLFISRIKSFINWRSPKPLNQSRASQNLNHSRALSRVSNISFSQDCSTPGSKIIFLEKITSEHFIIGNQNQIDLVFIGGVVGNFIDTESLWELNISKPIKNLAIDSKKGHIAIESTTEIVIYHYDNKKIKQMPKFLTGIKTKCEGKFLRFIRDSVLAVFYSNYIQVYIIEDGKMRRKMCKQIKQAENMQLFQVPTGVQNILNIFYIQKSKTSKTFQLWYLQMNLRGFEIELTGLMKVYDIKDGLQKKMKLENFSKEIFLMNLGFEILAVKKGYFIDSVYLNIQQQDTFLNYMGNNRLLHLSPTKAEVYRFKIDLTSNPPHIDITSLDSIKIKKPYHYQYIGSLQLFDRNLAVFYQIIPHQNRRTKGQITYCFAITRHVTIEEKINQIFTFQIGKEVKDVEREIIEEKVDIARKIGLNQTEIYLELWNRTNKTTVEEYQFLLGTEDYKTIKNEIEKKMKKSSMLWRQVYKIQQSCFETIRSNLFSPRCNQEVVREFLTSHFLLRKLQLFKDISLNAKKFSKKKQQEQSDKFKINIQNYNQYSRADIKTLFLQLVSEYCNEDKDVLNQIRIFLKSFRFVFRIIYKQLLQDILLTAKHNLAKLLENFPELLPYRHVLPENEDSALYEGVWEDISRLQWQRNLHLESITTIDNREVICQLPKSLWFRRNFLTVHDLTSKSKEQIIKIHRQNNSDQIFYFFISKVFENINDEQSLSKIIEFIQFKYQKMPEHIHGKIFLYRKIFDYFKDNQSTKNNQKLNNFHQLLQLKDYQLFSLFFQIEKVKKGCLLKDIKQIYQKVGAHEELLNHSMQNLQFTQDNDEQRNFPGLSLGTKWFNNGILSYFSSQISQISDLKYILNRINNTKLQFFMENQHLIYVLVKSCALKIRVGSENDIPIDEIMCYLENIPLEKGSLVLQELSKIQKIKENVERFQEIKINMTIDQIAKNCEKVINALIDQEIKKKKVMSVRSCQQMTSVSYDILAQIQVIKQNIYTLQYSDLTFFVYLTKIMQQISMIPYAAKLLEDPYLKQHFSVNDNKVIEDIILFMYKKKMSQNPKYIENEAYLIELLKILDQDNQCRIYIQCELEYAKILSQRDNFVQYPITDKFNGITIVQLEERVQQLSGEFLLRVDVERLHFYMNKMQRICYEDDEATLYTSVNEIYEVIILKLIEENLILESIPITKRLLKVAGKKFQVIFPLMYINLISKQLTVECNKQLLRAVGFLFNQPLQVLQIVEKLIGKQFSTTERDQYFKNLAIKSQQLRTNYNNKNPILDPIYLQLIRNEEMATNFRNMIDQSGHHLIKTKQQFSNFQFSLIFLMLVQQPFVVGKYIFVRRYHLNYKLIRSFLSYVIKEEIFSSLRVLEFGRRLFNIVLEASHSFLPFESIASQYTNTSMDQTIEFDEPIIPEPILPTDDEFTKKSKMLESKLQKCIMAFEKKKASVLQQIQTKGLTENIQKKRVRIQKQLTNPVDLSEKAPSQYPFGDSDDDYREQEKFDALMKSNRNKKTVNEFNPTVQRNLLINRTTKNYAQFMSNKHENQPGLRRSSKGNNNGAQTRRSLKNSKRLSMEHSQQYQNNIMTAPQVSKFKMNNFQQNFTQQYENKNLIQSVNTFGVTKSLVTQVKQKNNEIFKSFSPQQEPKQDQLFQIDKQQGLKSNKNVQKNIQYENNHLKRQKEQQNVENGINCQINGKIKDINQNSFMPVKKMTEIILESIQEQDNNFYIDFTQLGREQQKNPSQFLRYLLQIITAIYNDSEVNSKTKINFIKYVVVSYPELQISKQFLESYVRFQSYHSKYDITIPINSMFPIDFLFTKEKQPRVLFDKVAQKIVNLVDQSNIYKISKIIHLAFKRSSFEQQFLFQYLCIAGQKFDKVNISINQLNMQLQKLTALIDKLPINFISERGSKMIQKMKTQQRKEKIIIVMINCLKKKKPTEDIQKFEHNLKKY